MFRVLSKRSSVCSDGICADHVFHFNGGDRADRIFNFEPSRRVVDVVCEMPLGGGEIPDEIHAGAGYAMPGTDGECFDRNASDHYCQTNFIQDIPVRAAEGLAAGVKGPLNPILSPYLISAGKAPYPTP